MKQRNSSIIRKTGETRITIELNIDGMGINKINTGVGFLDHMLELFARHGLFDINISCVGDIDKDSHHIIEDIGITLGLAFKEAICDKKGIKRYGQSFLPMDETLCLCAVDFSGRPYLVMDARFNNEKVGDFPTECAEDFFYSFAVNSGMNIQMKMMNGRNDHHKIEAMFKSFARALREACEIDPRAANDIPSTKGVLD
jgi:imidazoleglycerol-phosphate dehydratase